MGKLTFKGFGPPDDPMFQGGAELFSKVGRLHSANQWRPSMIISGGQTGVDRAALDWAIAHKVPHGGWCPKGRLASDGRLPDHYQLIETASAGYSQRTRANVMQADATLILTCGPLVGGSKLTLRFACGTSKPSFIVDLDLPLGQQLQKLRDWQKAQPPIYIINLAGPSESRCPGIYDKTLDFMNQYLGDN